MSPGRVRLLQLTAWCAVASTLTTSVLYVRGVREQRRAAALVQAAAEARETVASVGTAVTTLRLGTGILTSRARVHRGAGRVVIQYLDGAGAGVAVYRQGMGVTCLRSGCPCSMESATQEGPEALDLTFLRNNYVARIFGHDTVAGRRVVYVALRDRRGYRGVHLWLDQETNLPLRTVVTDGRGNILSETTYESISYTTLPPTPLPSEARPAQRRITPASREQASAAVGFPLLEPSYLPRGFQLRSVSIHEFQGRKPAAELRYSDGVNLLSVLEMRAATVSPKQRSQAPRMGCAEGAASMGPGATGVSGCLRAPTAEAFGGSVSRIVDGILVVVVGELPLPELERVVDNIKGS